MIKLLLILFALAGRSVDTNTVYRGHLQGDLVPFPKGEWVYIEKAGHATNGYRLGIHLEFPDWSITQYGFAELSNGLPILYREKIVTTVLSNADFVVSNLPPVLDGIDFVSVYRNGALSWTSAPALKKIVTVWYKDRPKQFEPTNSIELFTNAARITLWTAGSLLKPD